MRSILLRLALAVAACAFCRAAAAQVPAYAPRPEPVRITLADAVERAKALDGLQVEFEGEAIGEVMERGSHAWVNLEDPGGALGVWVEAKALPKELAMGSWRRSGDLLLVRGIFHRACAEHGGDLDLHAESVAVLGKGSPTEHPVAPARLAAAFSLLLLAGGLFPLWMARERLVRTRRGPVGREASRAGGAGRKR
jgi:hypothetical protein